MEVRTPGSRAGGSLFVVPSVRYSWNIYCVPRSAIHSADTTPPCPLELTFQWQGDRDTDTVPGFPEGGTDRWSHH